MERSKEQLVSSLARLGASGLEEFKLFLREYEDPTRCTWRPLRLLSAAPRLPDGAPRITERDLERLCPAVALADLLLERFGKKEISSFLDVVLPGIIRLFQLLDQSKEIQESYNMDQARKAFVMCMKKDRPGAGQDIENIERWLTYCKFDCISCIDPDKEELMEKLTQFRDGINKIKDNVSCCFVALMAHGGRGFIKTKLDGRINLSDIFEMFNNKNCPALQGKPRIFLIQACRGDQRDCGVIQVDAEAVIMKQSKKKRLPTSNDSFIIYSTQVDYVALRHSIYGSVMVQAIDEVFKKHGNKWHIVDFFTQVNNIVVKRTFSLENSPIKMSLVMESTLTKAVYF